MLEVEVKYRLSSREADDVAQRVAAGEARRQLDEVYLLGSSSWADFVPGQPVLRIRQENDVVALTVKAARNSTTALEAETVVDSLDRVRAVLQALGAAKVVTISKTRRVGRLGGVVVTVDAVDGLGYFVELEVVVACGQGELLARLEIEQAAEELGLKESNVVSERYDEMLALMSSTRSRRT